jgi:hypothetical protein
MSRSAAAALASSPKVLLQAGLEYALLGGVVPMPVASTVASNGAAMPGPGT